MIFSSFHRMDVRSSYDAAAQAYAEHLFNELEGKPLDRHLLNRFAESLAGRGKVADLGCGPGHVARYLHDRGVEVAGVDISPGMIATARRMSPDLPFDVGDMTSLGFDDESLRGLVGFYAIVHFDSRELKPVFDEFHRVLAPEGLVLLAFHVGDESRHVDDLWGTRVDLDFHFHSTGEVKQSLEDAGFVVLEVIERAPYPEVEYPSQRCYLLAKRA
jgi:ubiquinone/menaquinone biosynthesis C-methylase UbiE